MFGFTNWLLRRLARKQRQSFRYWDGRRLRSIDPVVAYRGLASVDDFDWDRDPVRIERGDDKALQRTIAATRSVFDVKPFSSDGDGLTEDESLELLISFVDYMAEQKKSGNRLLILLQHTEPESSPGTSEETTSADSASSSTPNGNDSEPSMPLSSPSTQPSAGTSPSESSPL